MALEYTEAAEGPGTTEADRCTGVSKEPFGTLEVIDGELDETFEDDEDGLEGCDGGFSTEPHIPASAGPVISQEIVGGNEDFESLLPQFRAHFESKYHPQGGEFSDYEPAYRYGYDLAQKSEYAGRDWDAASEDGSADFDGRFGEGAWDRVKDSVRYGWDKVRGRM